jgi:hypothetical protein
MPINIFYSLVYLTLGISFIPICLIVYFKVRQKRTNVLIVVISTMEFSTFFSNLFLDYIGYGYLQIQFTVYSLINIICWVFFLLLNKFSIIKRVLFLVVLLAIIYISELKDSQTLQIVSKFLQLILGIKILLDEFDFSKNGKYKKSNYLIFTAIGLILYSVSMLNLIVFRDVLLKMELNSFYLSWSIHQIISIIYFSLLSISIWKSQKI